MKHTKNILLLALLGTVATLGIKHFTTEDAVTEQGEFLTAEQADAQLRAKGISPTEYTNQQLQAATTGDEELLRLLTAAQPGRIVRGENNNTPLHIAAQNGHAALCELLATQHHVTNEINATGQTALHLAAKEGHEACVDILISRGANIDKSDLNAYSPLLYAIEGGHAACVQRLLEAGASVQARLADGTTAAELAAKHPEIQQLINPHITPIAPTIRWNNTAAKAESKQPSAELYSGEQLVAVITQGDAESMQTMLDTDLSPDYRINNKTPLIVQATLQNKPKLVELLLKKGAAVDARASNGDLALHEAATLGYADILSLLLTQGADPNSTANGTSALIKAITGKHAECVTLLMKAGAGINSPSAHGKTPLIVAVETGQADTAELLIKAGADVQAEVNGTTALQVAVQHQQTTCVQLLIDYGANAAYEPSNKRTPLHIAAEVGSADCADLLLKAGAKANLPDANHETPLHLAAKRGHLSTVEQLIRHKAPLNVRDAKNHTPLHLAAAHGQAACISALCAGGAELNQPTADGYTPLHLAAKEGLTPSIVALLDAGADAAVESYHGETPIELAKAQGNTDCVRTIALHLLKKHGIESVSENALLTAIAANEPTHVELLIYADCGITEHAMITAAKSGHAEILQCLLAAGGNVRPAESATTTPLHAAAAAGHEECVKLLILHNTPIHVTDASGKTAEQLAESAARPACASILSDARLLSEKGITARKFGAALTEAAATGDHLTLRRLLNVGADIEYRDAEGNTALHHAATAKTVTCTKLLLELGASPDVLNNKKESPLMVATRLGRSSHVRALLAGGADPHLVGGDDIAASVAIKHKQRECLLHLLDGGTDVNAVNGKEQPLIFTAIATENHEMLNILLQRGADPNLSVNDTPLLFITARGSSPQILKILLESGKLNLHTTNELGESATHIAAQASNIGALALLLQSGVRVDLRDKEGQNILHHAARYNRSELIGQLLKIGMKPNTPDNRGRTPLDIAKQAGHDECVDLLSGSPDAL